MNFSERAPPREARISDFGCCLSLRRILWFGNWLRGNFRVECCFSIKTEIYVDFQDVFKGGGCLLVSVATIALRVELVSFLSFNFRFNISKVCLRTHQLGEQHCRAAKLIKIWAEHTHTYIYWQCRVCKFYASFTYSYRSKWWIRSRPWKLLGVHFGAIFPTGKLESYSPRKSRTTTKVDLIKVDACVRARMSQ